MSSMAKRGAFSSRYMWTKLVRATEDVLTDLSAQRSRAAAAGGAASASTTGLWSQAVQKFKESYNQQLTSVILVAGTAMAPTINKGALSDKSATEKLVVRLIPRPSPRTVSVGDVVAFNSPIDASKAHVMVRRVAALEGSEMVSDEPEDESFVVPPGHAWVLADNAELTPPDVVDSRVFGYIPMNSILGRVIYQVTSKEEHGPVTNSPESLVSDLPIIEQEVDVEQLAGQ